MDPVRLVARQRDHFRSGATLSPGFRREQLRRLESALAMFEAELLGALWHDLHKSANEAYTSEIALVLGEVRHALGGLPAWMKDQPAGSSWLAWPSRGFIRPEPRGVALVVGPWNYPVQLILSPLVSAIAAGNCAVLKPSEFAPRTSAVVARLIRATFPEEYIAVVEGEREVAEALLRERFDVIFFTGSTAVGRAVMTAAARHLTPVTLELGGKCPCIVTADAPVELAARRIAWGKFMNAGQTCVAPDHVHVNRSIRDEFVAAMKRALAGFYGGDPEASPDFGRIVNRRHFDRLVGYLGEGRILHGGAHRAETLYLAPTLLADARPDAAVRQEEIFGPILPVLEFEDLDRVLAELRDRPVPLALYLFSRDRAIQERVLRGTRSGGACLNDTVVHMIGQGLPFGGLGESGLGACHGKAGFDVFTHHRSVLRRSTRIDLPVRYPPPRISLSRLKVALRFLLGG